MADEHTPDQEFDHYVVDARRRARWTESTRHRQAPAPGGPASRPPAAASWDRTRAMPAVDPRDALPPLPTASAARPHAAQPPVPPQRPLPPVTTGTSPAPRPARRRTRVRWGRVVGLVVALWLAFLVLTPLHAWTGVSRADTAPTGERPTNAGGHNYLLLGSDSRVGMSDADRARLGASAADGQRTDSIILVHVPDHGGKASLVSVPRDSYVPIPGHGSHKINAAYSIGGPKLLTQTLEQVGDVRIDGTLQIGFGGFADVVDSLGGVQLCPTRAMKDPEAGIDIAAGCQTMDGPTALGYVRTRHSDPRGDLGRADRQREFLGALMKQAASPSTVLLPWRYWGFTHSASSAVQISDGMSSGDVVKVLTAMRGTGSGDTLSLMMPVADMGYRTSSDGSAVKWDTERSQALFTMIREDTPMQSAPPGTNG